MYKKEYGEVFSNSKKPAITIAKTLTKIPKIVAVGNGRGRKYKIVAYKADIKVLDGNEKEEMFIWLTNVFYASPERIIEYYGNRWLIETLFEEAKGEWYINKLPSRNLEAIAKRFD